MLLLGSNLEIAGLTIFADHVSPTTFHYLPGTPRLVSTEGRPGAELLLYRGGPATEPFGGGLLTLDVHLGHDARALTEARETLGSRVRQDVTLLPVTFNEGHVRLSLLDVDSRAPADAEPTKAFLVEHVLGTATPSLFGDARAIFSVALGVEGATLVEQALRSRSLPVILIYELAFEGLRLARGLRARVEYRMAYEFLRSRTTANMLAFKGDVDREAEALQREKHISIEDVDYVGTEPDVLASRAEEIRTTLHELVQALFFRPAPSPAALPVQVLAAQPPVDRAWAGSARGQAAFVLRDLAQQETGRLDYDLSVTRVARQTIAPQAALTALEGFEPGTAIREVDLTEAPPREIRAVVPADADWTGVGAVELTLQPSDGSSPVSDVLRPDRTELTMRMPPGEVRYSTRVLVKPDVDALGAPTEITSPFVQLPADTIVLDPASLADRHLLTLALTAVGRTSRITARGSFGHDGMSRPFVLDAARPSLVVPVWGRPSLRLSVAVEIDGVLAYSDDRELGRFERLVAINPPADRVQLVVIELIDPAERFESVFVEIEAVPEGRRDQLRLDQSTPRQEWTAIFATADSARRFRYRVRKVFKTAQSVDLPWQDGAGQLLLVGDTAVRVVPIDVVLIGAPPDMLAVELTVVSLGPPPDMPATTRAMIEQGTRATLRVPFAASEPTRYRVDGRVFTETGERAIVPVEDVAEVCLVKVAAD